MALEGRLWRRCWPCGADAAGAAASRRAAAVLAHFWLLGLLNNSAYVICLALATEISAGGVGLVYFAAIAPTILVKATVPLWYHAVPAAARMAAVGGLMAAAYCTIAFGRTLGAQLAGVAVVALQGGLGEATVLALCARYPPADATLTAWASGTGFAGVFGYLWVAALRVWLRLSFGVTLLLANGLAGAWLAAYFLGLRRLGGGGGGGGGGGAGSAGYDPVSCGETDGGVQSAPGAAATEGAGLLDGHPSSSSGVGGGGLQAGGLLAPPAAAAHSSPGGSPRRRGHAGRQAAAALGSPGALSVESGGAEAGHSSSKRAGGAAVQGRFTAVLALWPYTVPLFVVYAAEYTMQSGTWSAIGFPVESEEARRAFYMYSNWAYQAAVFISRSSGTLLPVGRRGLWAMPALQCVLLAWFVANAALHWWYNWGLLVLCFAAGLLGGATYVNAFTLLSREVPAPQREFSLAAACVADSLGIAVADAAAVFLQGCLLRANGLADVAVFKCGA